MHLVQVEEADRGDRGLRGGVMDQDAVANQQSNLAFHQKVRYNWIR